MSRSQKTPPSLCLVRDAEVRDDLVYLSSSKQLSYYCLEGNVQSARELVYQGIQITEDVVCNAVKGGNVEVVKVVFRQFDYSRILKKAVGDVVMIRFLLKRIEVLDYNISNPLLVLEKCLRVRDKTSFEVLVEWFDSKYVYLDDIYSKVLERVITLGWIDVLIGRKLDYECLKVLVEYESIAMRILNKVREIDKREIIELCCIHNSVLLLSNILTLEYVEQAIFYSIVYNSYGCFKIICSKYDVVYLPNKCSVEHLRLLDKPFLNECMKYMSSKSKALL